MATILPGLAEVIADSTDHYEAHTPTSEYNEAFEVPWVELETQVKQLPRDDDLTEVHLDKLPQGLRLYADFENISISDKDYVTRLWVVVKSKQGAYNGSYEGFRCANKNYKVYAYANPKRSKRLRVIAFPQWKYAKQGRYRDEFMKNILCHDTRPHVLSDIIDNLSKDSTTYDSSF